MFLPPREKLQRRRYFFLLFILRDQFLLLRSSRLFLCISKRTEREEEEEERLKKGEVDRKWKERLFVGCATFMVHSMIVLPLYCLLYFHYFVVRFRHLKGSSSTRFLVFFPILTFVGNNIYVSFKLFFSFRLQRKGRRRKDTTLEHKDCFKVTSRKMRSLMQPEENPLVEV